MTLSLLLPVLRPQYQFALVLVPAIASPACTLRAFDTSSSGFNRYTRLILSLSKSLSLDRHLQCFSYSLVVIGAASGSNLDSLCLAHFSQIETYDYYWL